jgi:hypothetical protein
MPPARTTPIALAVLLALLIAVMAAPALASPTSVIRDCSEDGVLNGKYSQSELDGALEQLPSDLDEYTDCRAVIRRAQLGSAGNKRHSPRKTSAAERVDAGSPPTGGEQHEIDKAAGAGGSVRIGGEGVRPGASAKPFNSAGFGTDLPPFILIVLVALGGLCAAGLAMGARRRRVFEGALEGVRRGISRFRR